MIERNKKGHFAKGCSGNSKGKVKGTRNKSTIAALSLLEGESEALTRKVVELALEGDTVALRLCLDRIVPPAKERPIENFEFPELTDANSVLEAFRILVQRLTSGDLLPSEAKSISHILEKYQQQIESTVLAERIEAIELILKGRKK